MGFLSPIIIMSLKYGILIFFSKEAFLVGVVPDRHMKPVAGFMTVLILLQEVGIPTEKFRQVQDMHFQVKLSEEHFDRGRELLQAAMEKNSVSDEAKKDWLTILDACRPYITASVPGTERRMDLARQQGLL